jgi:AraC-like DNA-binding protein
MSAGERVEAWDPGVPGIAEVFHAHFIDHAYPLHTHSTWALLIIDQGAVRYDLDGAEHAALTSLVTLLPPDVAHDGRALTADGFSKRVIYLEPEAIGPDLVGRSVDRPEVVDAVMRTAISDLDHALAHRGDELEAESRLALVRDRLRRHLVGADPAPAEVRDRSVAGRIRALLDDRTEEPVRLAELARAVEVSPTHVVRSFTREYGLPPHRYLIGRRIDRARRLLLAGVPIADIAQATGFHDQAHFTRHFRGMTGVPPGRYRNGR